MLLRFKLIPFLVSFILFDLDFEPERARLAETARTFFGAIICKRIIKYKEHQGTLTTNHNAHSHKLNVLYNKCFFVITNYNIVYQIYVVPQNNILNIIYIYNVHIYLNCLF